MKILKSIIEKQLEIKDLYLLRRLYTRAFYKFYEAYSLSLSFLLVTGEIKLDAKQIRMRNRLYKNLLLNKGSTEKKIKIFSNLMKRDLKIINLAVSNIDKINESMSGSYGSFYRPGLVAVDMDEYPMEN